MRFRRLLPVALALCAWTACKDKDGKTDDKSDVATLARLDTRCEQLAKACGDKPKHVEKITEECKQVGAKQVAKACTDKALALYDCYEKQLCVTGDKVWTVDDLRVLAERHNKCVAERTAVRTCVGE